MRKNSVLILSNTIDESKKTQALFEDQLNGMSTSVTLCASADHKQVEQIIEETIRRGDRQILVSAEQPLAEALAYLDTLRWRYAQRSFGSIIITDEAIGVQQLREVGVYRSLTLPEDSDCINGTLRDLSQVLASRETSETKTRRDESEFSVRVIRNKDQLKEHFRLRYQIWDQMNYIDVNRRNTSRLEIDPYDNHAVHFGCFHYKDGKDTLVGLLRFVTPYLNPYSAGMIKGIVDETSDPVLKTVISSKPRARIICEESYPITETIDGHHQEGDSVCELSRTIVHPDYKGSNLARKVMEFGIAFALSKGYPIAFGACVPNHVPFYAKYGYQPLEGIDLHVERNVQQVAYPVAADFRKLPEPTYSNVQSLLGCGLAERIA